MSANEPPVPFEALASADLTVGRVYKGGFQPHVGADPLHYLTGVGNSGGFRSKVVKATGDTAMCVLFSTGAVSEWPDGWDADGNYVYFGDQRNPGADLLATPRRGNHLLADVAVLMRRGERGRRSVPPFLLFEKVGLGEGRDVRFEGLLVPASDDGWLTVEHRTRPEGVFVNYRAVLRPLPVPEVSRIWLADILNGDPHAASAPEAWTRWVAVGDTV